MNMKAVRIVLAGSACMLGGLFMIGAGEPESAAQQPTLASPGAHPSGVAAQIADAAFLAGRWQGTMAKNKDSFVEEIWSEPGGRNAIGMFRWNKPDGVATVQELLTITEEDGTLLLRLRHQNAAGVAWEEKDKPLVFALAEKSPTLLRFDSLHDAGDVSRCCYEMREGKLFIGVEFSAPTAKAAAGGKKQRPPLNFELNRKPF